MNSVNIYRLDKILKTIVKTIDHAKLHTKRQK